MRPSFTWSASPEAVSYTLVVSQYANLSSPVINVTTLTAGYSPMKDLPAGKKLYWHVRANGANPSPWSTTCSFTSTA